MMSVEINRFPVKPEAVTGAVYATGDDRPVGVPKYAQGCEVYAPENVSKARYLTGGSTQMSMSHDKPEPRPNLPYQERQIMRQEMGIRAARCILGSCPFAETVETCFRRAGHPASSDPDLYDLRPNPKSD